jgi:hypothetical protein
MTWEAREANVSPHLEADPIVESYGVRTALLQAYVAIFGKLYRAYGSALGGSGLSSIARMSEEAQDEIGHRKSHEALQAFSQNIISLLGREDTRYSIHGIAEASIAIGKLSARTQAIIDLGPLQISPPRVAWMREAPDNLRVFISSGKQPHRQGNTLRLTETSTVEGIVIRLNYGGLDHKQIPYTTEMIPLYTPRR